MNHNSFKMLFGSRCHWRHATVEVTSDDGWGENGKNQKGEFKKQNQSEVELNYKRFAFEVRSANQSIECNHSCGAFYTLLV